MNRKAFETEHPAIVGLYFLSVVVLSMVVLEPVCVALSFAAAAAYLVLLRGIKRALASLIWYLGMGAVVAISNALFSGMGLTVLWYLGDVPVTTEALLYGACAGGMLVSVILWFSCYEEEMGSERFLYLFSRPLPTISMMITMIFRLVPELLRRAREIDAAQCALVGGEDGSKKARRRRAVRMTSILMTWSMESCIETADSMRCRGYGVGRRTAYRRYPMDAAAVASLAILCLLAAGSGAALWMASGFSFYPTLSALTAPWWGYLLYGMLLFYPLVRKGGEWIAWMRLR